MCVVVVVVVVVVVDVLLSCLYSYLGKTITRSLFPLPDPDYQQGVPNLDGGEGASEHILFGTNIDWKNGVERGKWRITV